jgi:hypothetical protein
MRERRAGSGGQRVCYRSGGSVPKFLMYQHSINGYRRGARVEDAVVPPSHLLSICLSDAAVGRVLALGPS